MPEQLKPCPICGDTNPIVNADSGHVICCKIVVDNVAAWNSLPRALTWTTEPPRCAGKHFMRFWFGDHWGEPDIINVESRYIGKVRPSDTRQWSDGPIQEPGE